jgi:hypothetical protein
MFEEHEFETSVVHLMTGPNPSLDFFLIAGAILN